MLKWVLLFAFGGMYRSNKTSACLTMYVWGESLLLIYSPFLLIYFSYSFSLICVNSHYPDTNVTSGENAYNRRKIWQEVFLQFFILIHQGYQCIVKNDLKERILWLPYNKNIRLQAAQLLLMKKSWKWFLFRAYSHRKKN